MGYSSPHASLFRCQTLHWCARPESYIFTSSDQRTSSNPSANATCLHLFDYITIELCSHTYQLPSQAACCNPLSYLLSLGITKWPVVCLPWPWLEDRRWCITEGVYIFTLVRHCLITQTPKLPDHIQGESTLIDHWPVCASGDWDQREG